MGKSIKVPQIVKAEKISDVPVKKKKAFFPENRNLIPPMKKEKYSLREVFPETSSGVSTLTSLAKKKQIIRRIKDKIAWMKKTCSRDIDVAIKPPTINAIAIMILVKLQYEH